LSNICDGFFRNPLFFLGVQVDYKKPAVTRFGTLRDLTKVTFGNVLLQQQAQDSQYRRYSGDTPVLYPETAS